LEETSIATFNWLTAEFLLYRHLLPPHS